MLRISKLTDYAVVLTTHLAGRSGAYAVRDLSAVTGIPEPTARKVLKLLARAEVVASVRGARGGYRLARPPAEIAIVEVIGAIEGPVAVTECSTDETAGSCEYEGACDVQANWQRINAAIQSALEGISLADMARAPDALVPLALSGREAALRREAST